MTFSSSRRPFQRGDEKFLSNQANHLYEFGPYRLDTAERLLVRDGQPVPLTPKAFETLVALVERSGHLVPKDELMKVVWADAFVEESNLTNNVYALRKMLGHGENGQSYIETVPKRGYRFTAPVKESPAAAVVVEKRTLTRVITEETVADHSPQKPAIESAEALVINQPRNHAQRSKLRWLWVGVFCLAVVIGGTFIYRSLTVDRSLTAAPRRPIESIAVLPFKNESGNPDVEYLSDGVTESLINSLSQLSQLKVIARNSSFQYKGKDVNPQDVSRALSVHAIIVGHVVQRDDNLVLSVELIDARDKTQVWGERYTRKATDVQAVQEDIARTISEKLRVKLTGAQEQQIAKRATENPQAYELYLTGLFHFRKPGIEGIRKSLDYFNQAVSLDPKFALAWVEVARVNRFLVGISLIDPKEALPIANSATLKALELDENLAEAHLALAATKKNEWDWAGAEREFKRAIELNPNLAEAHNKYSSHLSKMERHNEALAENRRAQELDPLRIGLRGDEAAALLLARRYDEAIEKTRQYIELNPGHGIPHVMLGFMYEGKGMYGHAINEFHEGMSIIGETTSGQIYLGYALAMSGKKKEARSLFEKLKKSKEYVSPSELAYLDIALGDKEGAMIRLERAYAARDPHLQNLKVDAHFDSLRSDPGFQDLLRRVGL
jgi:TolB-like protein/DNA-binding winged helix-turn-helix (wHTH) protein/tetratricopeptide (TPR) repeat protein